MKTPRKASDLILAELKNSFEPADMDARYRDMLDECYSFKSVGGPFAYMQPSSVLENEDPTSYRCGFNDWLDGEDVTEIGSDNWDDSDVEEARETVTDELEAELTALQRDLETAESELDGMAGHDDESQDEIQQTIELKQSEISDLETLIKEVADETF